MADLVTEVVFPARLQEVPAVVEAVAEAGRGAGLAPEALMHLELCVEEAVVNICEYAYPGGEGSIQVRVQRAPEALTVEVVDRGEPFDPLSLPPPDLHEALEERPIGGLGVFVIRQLMDEVRYERTDGANVLTMLISLDAAADH